jgi:hypothetical protein
VELKSTGSDPHSQVKITRGGGPGDGSKGGTTATINVSQTAGAGAAAPTDDVDPIELLLCAWVHSAQAEATAVGASGSKQPDARFEESPLVTWKVELDFDPDGRTAATSFSQLWMAGCVRTHARDGHF